MQESILLTDKEYQEYNELSRQIIGAAIEVHQELGAGLLESAYGKSMQSLSSNKKLCISVPLC
ncbi:MAG: hypothetical protein J6Y23_03865 [Prevotella sp.]|nr:hypothetical protein [Prevotella sp.]